jgi:hypothetical protein
LYGSPTIQPKLPGKLDGWSWRRKSADIPHNGFPRPLEAMKGGGCGIRVSAEPLCAKTAGAGRNTQKLIRKSSLGGDFAY